MAKSFQLRGGEANRAADAATVFDAATAYATATATTSAFAEATASAYASAAAIIWMTLQPLQEAQGQEHRKQHQPAFLLCAR